MHTDSHDIEISVRELPAGERARREYLQQLFPEHIATANRTDAGWQVSLRRPQDFSFHVDPELPRAIAWWDRQIAPAQMADSFRRSGSAWVSLHDSWGLAAISEWFAERDGITDVVYLHADDHGDLSAPLLTPRGTQWVDLLTGREVRLDEAATIDRAIRSGAIGIGSFLPLLFHSGLRVHFRHLRHLDPLHPGWRTRPCNGSIRSTFTEEGPWQLKRPAVSFSSAAAVPTSSDSHPFITSSEPTQWLEGLPLGVPALLHIDLDVFCNRYDRDSDWELTPRRHDPPLAIVMRRVDELFDAMLASGVGDRLEAVHVAFSPGFFPGEMWKPVYTLLGQRLRDLGVELPAKDGEE